MIAHDVRRVIAQAPALVETALGDDARRDRAIRVAGDDQRLVATHQRAVYVRDWHADDRGGRRQHQREVPVGAEHVHRTGVVADGKVPRQSCSPRCGMTASAVIGASILTAAMRRR